MTERDRRGANAADAPLLTTAYASGEPGSFPPARALARAFPLGDDGRRILIAVAAGIGDPPSAEAQALEALGRLEAVVAQATAGAPPRAILQAGYDAADEGITRLKSLPGSAQKAGVVMVAALIDGVVVTFAALGTPAALLRRGAEVRRLTPPAVRGKRALGLGGPVAPEFSGPVELAPGDTLLLCTQSVTRDLGEDVIEAALEEFGPEDAAHDLADLAAQQPGSDGAAVALLHLPRAGGHAAAAPLPAAVAASGASEFAPVAEEDLPSSTDAADRSPAWLTLALLALAIIAGAVAVLAIVRWQGGLGGSSPSNNANGQQAIVPGVPIVGTPTVFAAPVTPAVSAIATRPAASPTSRAAAVSPNAVPRPGSPTPALAAATVPPIASLPACDSTNATPCRYTAQAGDSMSVIGDRFSLSAACFVAANSAHVGVSVALPNPTIGLGEDYVIPSAAECATLVTATPAAAPSSSPIATPQPICTPRPGATAPPPEC